MKVQLIVVRGKPEGKVIPLAGSNFKIGRGEIFGFIGSNGCGKTTTMKMLTGLLAMTEGRAELLGRPVKTAPVTVGPDAEAAAQALQPGEVLLLENTRFDAQFSANTRSNSGSIGCGSRCHSASVSCTMVPCSMKSSRSCRASGRVPSLNV